MEMPLRPNAVVWYPRPPRYKWGPENSKASPSCHICVARAKCGVLETDCSRTALFTISNSEQTMSEFYQVMIASDLTPSPVVYPDYYSTPYDQTADYGPATCPKDEEEIIVIPEKFRHVFY